MTAQGATHYRLSTDEYLLLESGKWYISINGYWQLIKNPFRVEMVEL